ncbi:MAG: peptide chain release factor N(5)-glutamine methyltransferase, partial [Candidatus Binatia bacterium]
FAPVRGERFDLVVTNPPYARTDEIAGLEPEVRDWDPRGALDGGPDGLEVIRRIAAEAPRQLADGAALALEIGAGQLAAVTDVLRAAGFSAIVARRDLAGIDRAVVARAGTV